MFWKNRLGFEKPNMNDPPENNFGRLRFPDKKNGWHRHQHCELHQHFGLVVLSVFKGEQMATEPPRDICLSPQSELPKN